MISYYDIFKESQIDLHYIFKEKDSSEISDNNQIQNGQKNNKFRIKKNKKRYNI